MKGKKWAKLLFAIYGVIMLWLLFGQRMGQGGSGGYWQRMELVYVPLRTIRRFLWVLGNSANEAQIRHAVVNLVGNVVMFVPLGFFAPCLWEKLRKFGYQVLVMALDRGDLDRREVMNPRSDYNRRKK